MYQAPRGTQDVLPEDAALWRFVEDAARRRAALAGFGEIRTPTFEDTGVFLRGVGAATDIVEKEMYTFLDKGGDSMTLRPEATAAVMRAYFEHGMASRPQPVKVYSFISAFRYDRPQKGRLREFHQFNAEAIGEPDPMVDADLVALQWDLYRDVGLRDLALHLNSIGDQACRPHYVDVLRSYFRQHQESLCQDCRRRMETAPLRLLDDKNPNCQPVLNAAPHSIDYLCGSCRDHFERWTGYLQAAGIPFEIDHRLVRGLDYYTRSVWEVLPPHEGAQSTVGGGGRYDGLAEQLGGRATPGVGFATGIERILLTLRHQGVEIPPEKPLDAYIACQSDDGKSEAFRLAEALRGRGVSADLAFGNRKLGKQLAAADRAGARFAIILGEEELANGSAVVKDLRDGAEQQTVPLSEIPALLADGRGA